MVAAGWAYWAAAWWTTRAFLRRGARPARSAFQPRVSILKPLKGVDAHGYENLASFCRQIYSDYQILFGVASPSDPAADLVRQLQREFPRRDIRLIVAGPLGANPKSATLHALTNEATGDVLAISDADIRVVPDYLSRITAPLADADVGLVTCPYRGLEPRGLAARLEALHMGAVFLPSVVFANRVMRQRVGMGATLAMRRADLERAGGYEAIADHLADDYQVAVIIESLGLRTHLSDCVVASVLGETRFADQWAREVRWARGIRVSCFAKYPGLLVTYPICWAVVLCALAGFGHWALGVLAMTFGLRWAIAWDVGRLLKAPWSPVDLLLLPLRDAMSFAVWGAGLFGSAITWRGERFQLLHDGRLAAPRVPGGIVRYAVRRFDMWLRARQGIFEYSSDPDCVMRVSLEKCGEAIDLPDGTRLNADDILCELHFFNEHMPPLPADGANIRWAAHMQKLLRGSFAKLAVAFESDPRFEGVRAIRGTSVLGSRGTANPMERLARRLHFDVVDPATSPTLFARLHQAGENLLVWALTWTFNPAGLRSVPLSRERHRLFMSRRTLLEQYAAVRGKGADSAAVARYEKKPDMVGRNGNDGAAMPDADLARETASQDAGAM
ncbi:MAG: hopanoid biosynthesis associated glycosyl transferase protein HpnI [Phycisphaerales bacterium]|nr:hopanoid biosynthesis associated glycosyl transferase protein HpnI [Phycisphaerales bacterium]MDB5358163.1 hopanoid biosynthesis associated glycosyl transferase protein HpnI [Phycisphaerales bacterium]